jgi:hypothetical protein
MNPYVRREAFREVRCFLCGRLLFDHEMVVRGDIPAGHALVHVVILDGTAVPQDGRGVTDSPTYGVRKTHRRNREGAVKQGVKG